MKHQYRTIRITVDEKKIVQVNPMVNEWLVIHLDIKCVPFIFNIWGVVEQILLSDASWTNIIKCPFCHNTIASYSYQKETQDTIIAKPYLYESGQRVTIQ